MGNEVLSIRRHLTIPGSWMADTGHSLSRDWERIQQEVSSTSHRVLSPLPTSQYKLGEEVQFKYLGSRLEANALDLRVSMYTRRPRQRLNHMSRLTIGNSTIRLSSDSAQSSTFQTSLTTPRLLHPSPI